MSACESACESARVSVSRLSFPALLHALRSVETPLISDWPAAAAAVWAINSLSHVPSLKSFYSETKLQIILHIFKTKAMRFLPSHQERYALLIKQNLSLSF